MPDKANIISIIVGGALALAGTIVSQMLGLLSGWVDRRHQRDIRQRERLEQLASAVSATIPWFQTLASCRTIEELRANLPPLEARRINILALLSPSLGASSGLHQRLDSLLPFLRRLLFSRRSRDAGRAGRHSCF